MAPSSNSTDPGGSPAARLTHPSQSVRRIALRDLAARADFAPIIDAMERGTLEDDEKTLVLAARLLAESGSACAGRDTQAARATRAMAALARVRDNPLTPARAYHAALLAHDTIEATIRRA
jgi:hypothetical protein